ncbi:cyclase family protein [Kribbella kalugense]|uniref:Kynurenine formamidase n=1 Tax=Kribbella kalugense TaxID=2512221 RepID=A0A4R8A1X6_9ACTN|nr:cyclase family protein [Kribbella kalugense]TDW24205.1 kynurenine formamidase [Kribbella kalugense]
MTGRSPTEAEVLGYVESLSNWGRWGPEDQLGTLNLITPAVRRKAASLVRHGATVSLARELAPVAEPGDAFAPPQRYMLFTGEGLADEHRVRQHPAGRESDSARVHGASEYIGMVFHGFNVTHVDALSHVFWDRRMYNGKPPELVNSLFGASSHAVTAAGDGIVTRGVLLDVAAARGVEWLEPGTGVTPVDLELAESRQGVQVREGDAVLLRTGHGLSRARLGPQDPNVHGQPGWHPAALPWLHERGAALIGCDAGVDVLPCDYPALSMPVHVIGIVTMGLWLVDNLDLEAAASTAERMRRWEFLFTLAPLRLTGGTGSPANPLAVF